jgi:hypothetical protein
MLLSGNTPKNPFAEHDLLYLSTGNTFTIAAGKSRPDSFTAPQQS